MEVSTNLDRIEVCTALGCISYQTTSLLVVLLEYLLSFRLDCIYNTTPVAGLALIDDAVRLVRHYVSFAVR